MRFTKLVVESFQAIQRAELEFGPGLNILYGPNDLGKSTLGSAIRAALLVPPSSWYAGASSHVSLTFVDQAGHYWRVTKGFGDASHAELAHSKDGITFTLDCKARQVEEKLRTLLDWGIPSPGGRGAPRGLPQSFLTNVLLGAQTDVDGILAESLADDPSNSGKLRLTKALATLAQDPLFKKVLDSAQAEVDLCFTPKGQRKRGQGSRFVQASEQVKKLQDELSALQQQLEDSSAVEASVTACRERHAQALAEVEEAKQALADTKARLAKAEAFRAAQARLDEAQGRLNQIAAFAKEVERLEKEVQQLGAAAALLEQKLAKAQSACTDAAARLREAEEAHRLAAGEEGARRRELKRAQLAEQASQLHLATQKLEGRKAEVVTAVKAVENANQARAAAGALAAELGKLNREFAALQPQAAQAASEAELARAVLAYGRWQLAASAADDAAKAASGASAKRAEAEEKGAQARQLETQALASKQALVARQAALPNEAQLKGLQRLERELEMAEASLGGGFSVVVRARGQTKVSAVVDGKGSGQELAAESVLEAERFVRLAIGKQIDIEVTAGALEKRKAVEKLRARWLAEAEPALERAGFKSVAEVAAASEAIAKDAHVAESALKAAEALRLEAKHCLDQAVLFEDQAKRLAPEEKEVAARKAAIGPLDHKLLQAEFARLGKVWEAQAEKLIQTKVRKQESLKETSAELEQKIKLTEYRVSEAERLSTDSEIASKELLGKLGAAGPQALLPGLDKELESNATQQARIAAELKSLAAEGNDEVARAVKAVEAAKAAVEAAEKGRTSTAAELEKARSAFQTRTGERNASQAQLAGMDRPTAEGLVKQRSLELAALPKEPEVTQAHVDSSEEALTEAQRTLEQAKQELHTSEGALSKVGGAAVREEVSRLEEALELARVREKELEVDADAWKLLRDTLREVENEEGAHLGRALAQPVTKKFAELTGGRYEGLRLDTGLKAEGIEVAGATVTDENVISVLSAGTRDQLATLIRLTIAEQLKSAIVLDDHLVHTDPVRLAWFREVLLKTSLEAQVLVLTCRAGDYLDEAEVAPGLPAMRDVAGGTIRALDMERLVKRWGKEAALNSKETSVEVRSS